MIENVYDYFVNLDELDLPRNNEELLVADNNSIKVTRDFCYGKPSIAINNIPFYKKKPPKEYTIMEHATSKMYNEIGIMCPPTYYLGSAERHDCSISLISQYLPSIKKLHAKKVSRTLQPRHIIKSKSLTNDKWDAIHNPKIKNILQYYLTPEGFDKLIGLFLVDELRTEIDRHEDNFFFHKPTWNSKYNGIVAIDHALTEIRSRHNTDEDFKRFLESKYSGKTPTGICDKEKSHIERIKAIKDLIQNQEISPDNIQLLRAALEFDFAQEIYNAGNYLYLKESQIPLYDATSRLWEYNRQELNNDLGL